MTTRILLVSYLLFEGALSCIGGSGGCCPRSAATCSSPCGGGFGGGGPMNYAPPPPPPPPPGLGGYAQPPPPPPPPFIPMGGGGYAAPGAALARLGIQPQFLMPHPVLNTGYVQEPLMPVSTGVSGGGGGPIRVEPTTATNTLVGGDADEGGLQVVVEPSAVTEKPEKGTLPDSGYGEEKVPEFPPDLDQVAVGKGGGNTLVVPGGIDGESEFGGSHGGQPAKTGTSSGFGEGGSSPYGDSHSTLGGDGDGLEGQEEENGFDSTGRGGLDTASQGGQTATTGKKEEEAEEDHGAESSFIGGPQGPVRPEETGGELGGNGSDGGFDGSTDHHAETSRPGFGPTHGGDHGEEEGGHGGSNVSGGGAEPESHETATSGPESPAETNGGSGGNESHGNSSPIQEFVTKPSGPHGGDGDFRGSGGHKTYGENGSDNSGSGFHGDDGDFSQGGATSSGSGSQSGGHGFHGADGDSEGPHGGSASSGSGSQGHEGSSTGDGGSTDEKGGESPSATNEKATKKEDTTGIILAPMSEVETEEGEEGGTGGYEEPALPTAATSDDRSDYERPPGMEGRRKVMVTQLITTGQEVIPAATLDTTEWIDGGRVPVADGYHEAKHGDKSSSSSSSSSSASSSTESDGGYGMSVTLEPSSGYSSTDDSLPSSSLPSSSPTPTPYPQLVASAAGTVEYDQPLNSFRATRRIHSRVYPIF